jgi:O-antigen ligase
VICLARLVAVLLALAAATRGEGRKLRRRLVELLQSLNLLFLFLCSLLLMCSVNTCLVRRHP